MYKRRFSRKNFRLVPTLICLLTGVVIGAAPVAQAQNEEVSPIIPSLSSVTSLGKLTPVSDIAEDFSRSDVVQNDPLNSPYPIPWEWIQTTQAEFTEKGTSGLRYYRSPSLVSPDGEFAVYSRISLQVEPEMYRSRVTSVMFVENLKTGELQVIRAASPLGVNVTEAQEEEDLGGMMSVLIPVSWSEDGKRLLSRQFEGFFCTSDASDYGVIWERQTGKTQTINPKNIDYETAILMGWSSTGTNQVLFRTGFLGDEQWPLWSVALNGKTLSANRQDSIIYGQIASYDWTGAQVLR